MSEEKLFNRINFTGKGADFSSNMRKRSFFLTYGSWLYFFEPNQDAFDYYLKNEKLKKYKHIVFCISHVHDDAMNGINTFLTYINERFEGKETVYIVTRPKAVVDTLLAAGILQTYHDKSIIVDELVDVASLDILTVSMKHGDMDSCGFLVNDRESKTNDNVFYTGDCDSIPTPILKMFLEGTIKSLISDVTLQTPCDDHITFNFFRELVNTYGPTILYRIKFTHFQNEYEYNAITEMVERMIFEHVRVK